MIPFKSYLPPDSIENELVVEEWIEENRETVHRVSMEGCWYLANNQHVKEVLIIELYVKGHPFSALAEISLDRKILKQTLEDCKDWFVEREDYESAADVMKCAAALNIEKLK